MVALPIQLSWPLRAQVPGGLFNYIMLFHCPSTHTSRRAIEMIIMVLLYEYGLESL